MDKVVNDMKNNGNNIMEKEAKDRIMITLTSQFDCGSDWGRTWIK